MRAQTARPRAATRVRPARQPPGPPRPREATQSWRSSSLDLTKAGCVSRTQKRKLASPAYAATRPTAIVSKQATGRLTPSADPISGLPGLLGIEVCGEHSRTKNAGERVNRPDHCLDPQSSRLGIVSNQQRPASTRLDSLSREPNRKDPSRES